MANTFGIGTDTTNFAATVVNLVVRRINVLRATLPYLQPGSVRPVSIIAGHNGVTVIPAYPDLNPNDGALTEGVPPTALKMGIGSQSFTMTQRGQYLKVTDLAQMENGDNPHVVAAEAISRQMVETSDEIARKLFDTAGADIYGAGTSRATVLAGGTLAGGLLKTAHILDAVAILKSRNVQPLGGTNGSYVAVGHPFAFRGLLNASGLGDFTNVAAFANPARLLNGSLGEFRGVQFISSARGTSYVSAATGAALPTVTATASTDLVNSTAHGLVVGSKIQFSALTGGTGLVTATDYYVVAPVTTNAFKVAATQGGAAIDITADATAATAAQVNDVFRIDVYGAECLAFGDSSTLAVLTAQGPTQSDPLAQLSTVGWKAFLGGIVIAEPEKTDGAGVNAAAVPRAVSIDVTSGIGA